MSAIVEKICRYPVKGLSPDVLESVELAVGAGLPHDRRFAIAHGGEWRERGGWMPKRHFLNLMTNERLAALQTAFDAETGVLTISRKGRQVARGDITQPIGRALIDQFVAAYMQGKAVGTPHIVEQPGVMFGDTAEPLVSIVNLASVGDLERVIRRPVDPLRFRGNIMIDGVRPWAEADWIGREIAIGTARLKIVEAIGRCAATNVDPATGERDMNIPKSLMTGFRHADCGVYARTVQAGSLSVGDSIDLI